MANPKRLGRDAGAVGLKLRPDQGRAAARLRDLMHLALLLDERGEALDRPLDWLRVAGNALALLDGIGRWRLSAYDLRRTLPHRLRASAPRLALERAVRNAQGTKRLLGEVEAGELIGLASEERTAVEARGRALKTLRAIDETEEARDERRAARRREQGRVRAQRSRRKHAAAADAGAEIGQSYTPRHAAKYKCERDARSVTFRTDGAPAAILALLREGPAAIAQIVEVGQRASHSPGSLKVALSRLVRAGLVVRPARGRYALACGIENTPRQRVVREGEPLAAGLRLLHARLVSLSAPLRRAAASLQAAYIALSATAPPSAERHHEAAKEGLRDAA